MSPATKVVLRVGLVVLVLVCAVGVLGFLRVFRIPWVGPLLDQLRARVAEEQAGLDIAKTAAQGGAEAARAEVLARYGDKMEALNAQQKAHVEKLSQDPVALARYLVRVGSDSVH